LVCAAPYRPRRPRDSPLYRLVDEFYDKVKGTWEERFELLLSWQKSGFSVHNSVTVGADDPGSTE